MPTNTVIRPLQHFQRNGSVNAPSLSNRSEVPLDRKWLEPHPEVLALLDKWTDARTRLNELEAHAGGIAAKITEATTDYQRARRDALVAGTDPEAVKDERPALRAALAATKDDIRLMTGGVEMLGGELAQALQAVAPQVAQAAAKADADALAKVETASRTANKADADHIEAASVVRLMATLEVNGGRIGSARQLAARVPSVAITPMALDEARDYSQSILDEREQVTAWRVGQA